MDLYTSDGFAYHGMDSTTITRLRSELGQSTTFVDKAAYDAYIAAHQHLPTLGA